MSWLQCKLYFSRVCMVLVPAGGMAFLFFDLGIRGEEGWWTSPGFDPPVTNAVYGIQKPITRFSDSDGNTAMLVNALGNVGIGKSIPEATLDVAGDIRAAAGLSVLGGPVSIDLEAEEVYDVASGVSITAASGINIGHGGPITIAAGNAGRGAGWMGGTVTIDAGSSFETNGDGGDVIIRAGRGSGIGPGPNTFDSGSLLLQAGNGIDHATGGNVTIVAGAGSNAPNGVIAFEGEGGREYLRIDEDGDVGIGTTTPGAKLHVGQGDVLLDNGQALLGAGSTTGTLGLIRAQSGQDVNIDIGAGGTTNTSNIRFHTFGRLSAAISYTGNVGVGTTSPLEKLSLASNPSIRLEGVTNASGFKINYSEEEAALRFLERTFGSDSEVMRITKAGNLGIGTTSPQATLHVKDTFQLEPRASAPICNGDRTHGLLYYDDSAALCVCTAVSGTPQWVKLAGDGSCQ